MTDQIERSVREALSYQDAQLDHNAITRLRAVDYKPRRRRLNRLPAFGVLGTAGTAAVVAAVVSLTSAAAPAFAGWQATPAATGPTSAVAQFGTSCGQGLGTAVLTDSRGPYTAAIYSQGGTAAICLSGNNIFMSSHSTSATQVTPAAGQLLFSGGTTRDSAGDQLTLADGQAGTGVTAVTFDLSDGTKVQATVSGGWYMAWWPGAATASSAEVTTASGTTSVNVPAAPSTPKCPQGAQCSAGYSQSGSGPSSSSAGGQTLQSVSQYSSPSQNAGS